MKVRNLFRTVTFVLTICNSLMILMAEDVNYPPRLPLYIGKGYNILHGNPISSNGVDPGFNH